VRDELLEREPALRGVAPFQQRVDIGVGRRTMDVAQGLAQRRELESAPQRRGQQLERFVGRQREQRLGDQRRDAPLRDALDHRIDRRQRAIDRHALGDALVARVHHLEPARAEACLAVAADPRARRERVGLRTAEMEEAQRERRAAVVGDRDLELRPEAEAALDRHDDAFDLRLRAGLELRDRRDARAVLVAQRQVEPEVGLAPEPHRLELFRERGADPAQHPQVLAAREGFGLSDQSSTRIASTSTCAPRGSEATPIVERAGYGAWKNSAITALTCWNFDRSVR
jgi:hypothetical protein